MSTEDLLYYRRRAEREAEMAQRAMHPNAARAHALLAEHYRHIVESGGLRPFRAPFGRAGLAR
jgi:hypothetical protein